MPFRFIHGLNWVCFASAWRCAAWSLGLLVPFGVHASQDPIELKTQVLAQKFHHPWALAILPNQEGVLVTERRGRLWWLDDSVQSRRELQGIPPVWAQGQGGLLDVVLDRDFARNRLIYLCLSQPQGDGAAATALYRARLDVRALQLADVRPLFVQRPAWVSSVHFGCRIVQDSRGDLFLTLGDRGSGMNQAQSLDNHIGKVVRLHSDGTVPKDNPHVGKPRALSEIWSHGHRNMQGATLGLDGQIWTHEHGPQGGDEINVVQSGRNYGWPVITYGENYGGGKIGEGITGKPGMEQPLHHWVPSIAPSGMAFLNSSRYGERFKGRLLVGSLKFGRLHVLELRHGKVVSEHSVPVGARVRDVRVGPDGLIYVLTDESNGSLLRLMPR